jgi:6-phosphogluconolactonase (cycloisomerase 2 family)
MDDRQGFRSRVFPRVFSLALWTVVFLSACGTGENSDTHPKIYKDYVLAVVSGSNWIASFSFDRGTGSLTPADTATLPPGLGLRSIAIGPEGKFAYVVGHITTNIYAFSIDPITGELAPIPGSSFWAGVTPSRIMVGPSRRFAYVTSGEDGQITAHAIDAETGALRMTSGSPFDAPGSPAEMVIEPTEKYAFVMCAGPNIVVTYAIDGVTGALTPAAVPPVSVGTSPWAIALHPEGKFLYVVNEESDNVSAFSIDAATGALNEVAGSPFDDPAFNAFSPSDIGIDPSGRWAYVVNGSQSVSVFNIDGATGALTLCATQMMLFDSPNKVVIDPLGEYACISYFRPDGYVLSYSIVSSGLLSGAGGFMVGDYPRDVVFTRIAQ